MSETLFEIYTKEVDIKGKKLEFRPLSGRYLPKLYAVMSEVEKNKDKDGNIGVQAFSEDTMSKLHTLVLETLKKSYPDEEESILDEFASQNLMHLLQPLIEVNVGSVDDAERSG